jgi:myo-inositol-1(or 4)-monophosphatase
MKSKEAAKWLLVAGEAARRAGAALLHSTQNGRDIITDKERDVKIVADGSSESIILNYLREHSDFSILSEERGLVELKSNSTVWIVDPLDGSLNYSRGIPLCCVSIGLWEENQPVLGVIYDFHQDEFYSGIAGEVAWCNDREIKASEVTRKDKAVLCTGFPVNTDFSAESLMTFILKIQQYKKIRLLGSAALSLAYVASGRADAYMENDIMAWDVAAGLAIASGAGCKYNISNGIKSNSFRLRITNGNFDIDE